MDTVENLIRIARRENNKKRPFLVVNRLQGKYMPVSPGKALAMFEELAGVLRRTYAGEQILTIGFAETATAIGAAVAVSLQCPYLQTTREEIEGKEYLLFSEEHSHATEQRVVKNNLEFLRGSDTRIIFIDDEVTTGRTILNLISRLRLEYGNRLRFSVASLLNCMEPAEKKRYHNEGIALHALLEADRSEFVERAAASINDGDYGKSGREKPPFSYPVIEIAGAVNARTVTDGRLYHESCEKLYSKFIIKSGLNLKNTYGERVLVLGTEEFMYPALYVAEQLEKLGIEVRFHATTRGPVEVSGEKHYPLHGRYELVSLYDENRTTYLYNLEKYDKVYVFTDADSGQKAGEYALVNALADCGNEEITVVYWIP